MTTLPPEGMTGRGLLSFALAGERVRLAITAVLGLLATVFGFVVPLAGMVLAIAIAAANHDAVPYAAGALAGLLALQLLTTAVVERGLLTLTDRAQDRLESALWHRLLSLPSAFFRQYPLRRLMGFAGGVGQLRGLLGSGGLTAALHAVFALVAVALLALLDPWLAVAATGMFGLVLGAMLWLSVRQQRHDTDVLAAVDDVQAAVYPAMLGIDDVRAFGAQSYVVSRWREAFTAQKRSDDKGLRYSEIASALAVACYPALLAVLLPMTAGLGFTAQWTVVMVAMTLNLTAARLQGALVGLFSIGPVHARLAPVLTTRPETPPDPVPLPRARGAVVLDGVSFRYPGQTRDLLQDISLRIEPGEFVALVGASGAGKSTLLRLLLGLDHADRGRVLVDGVDVRHCDVDELRTRIGYVAQDATLMRGTLAEVICGAAGETDLRLAWQAAESAQLADVVRALPMGLHTQVTDGESGLSGGQVQRLLLARALAKRPSVLLLDEATSALDAAAQELVRRAVDDLRLTRVVVAHRLSTIRSADRIAVLEHGRIATLGTFAEVAGRSEAFARLVGTARRLD
ncbi:ATP-binding cassette domain-containing protein [Amycolatopsis echigonensis]|uniref:ATP-binding cassette domain-containing protein n=1 Tax=Amycolatopsis echigonensis TaxID=2576905 RepID=A0A8E1VWI7_9PSEU|nr:ATP-binding cassette domain-containing protein [Amycolatopsis echigonensis]MBB2499573.1 ATP-binding cassette domain-containing protein [Amycolatopsis echigonensis]